MKILECLSKLSHINMKIQYGGLVPYHFTAYGGPKLYMRKGGLRLSGTHIIAQAAN